MTNPNAAALLVAPPRSEAERALAVLRGAILAGELAPGAPLRPAELQRRYGLGLTPLREALVRLAAEGLADIEAQRGFRVRRASYEEFADLMATRRDIERLCLLAAVARGDEAWEAEVVAALHLLSRTPPPAHAGDAAAADLWEARHRRFHHALVAGCGSPWRLRFWNSLADQSERYRKLRLMRREEPDAGVRDLDAEHRLIAEAALARDGPAAADLMDAHLTATEEAVAKLVFGRGAARPRALVPAKGPRV
jgi:DNA-binding GntR family transcriptional regulator